MSTPLSLAVRLLALLMVLVGLSQSYTALGLRASEWAVGPLAGLLAWTYPLGVDGLVATGILASFELRRARLRARAYVWSAIGLGLAVSLLGNAPAGLIPGDTLVLRVFPPVALAWTVHLVIVLHRDERIPRARRAPSERAPEASPPLRPSAALLQLSDRTRSDHARALLAERPEIGLDELIAETKLSRGRARALRAERARALASG